MTMRLLRQTALATALLIGAALQPQSAASANTLCVNHGGTGGCFGTIADALTNAGVGDSIHVEGGAPYLERLTIGKSVSLVGDGPAATIIDGNALGQVIRITAAITVTLSNLTIRNGQAGRGDLSDQYGGGIHNENGNLTLNNVVVTGNHTGGGNTFQGGYGGGLSSVSGQVTLNGSLVTGNFSATPDDNPEPSGEGGQGGQGAGIFSFNTALVLNHSIVSQNFAGAGSSGSGVGGVGGSGGGIAIEEGALVLNDSTITDNASGSGGSSSSTGGSGGSGAGIYGKLTTITVNNSTISFNGAGLGGTGSSHGVSGSGAGLIDLSPITRQLTITTSTITDNQTGRGLAVGNGGDGGGVYVGSGVAATLVNVTLADNTTDPGQTGGGLANHGGSVSIKNVLFADNTTSDEPPIPDDCFGAITSLDYNVMTAPNCSISPGSNDQFFVSDPVVEPLANNGGPTQTNALPPGSPAVDAADNHACSPADQRGFARPAFGGIALRCDVGAFELYRFGVKLPAIMR